MEKQEFLNRYGRQLNRQQLEAVCSVDGPLLLLAVPGSGKTTVLVTRLGYMLFCCNIPPERILTLTYTVAATRDMEERFARIFGEEGRSALEFRTINGICAKIIAQYGQLIGKKPFELLTDEKQVAGILTDSYRKIVSDYPTESDIKNVRSLITYIKNRMLSTEEISELEKREKLPVKAIYEDYNNTLRSRSFMDYDDQLLYAYRMLQSTPQLLQYYREQYPYLCVDEAQDTSKIQHAIISLLAGEKGNLFMVGDEDQSIYGFRAAYPEALLRFEQEHPGAKVLLMEKNYRCGSKIAEAADGFIRKNLYRHDKHMTATRTEEGTLEGILLADRKAQYAYLAKVAISCERPTVVLYRDNESVLPLIDLLERQNIPYRIKNADLAFFTHRIVTDVKNLLRFALNPYDTEIFMQIYYKVTTYLKKEEAKRICEISRMENIPVFEAAENFPSLSVNTVKNCRAMRTHFRNLLDGSPALAIHRLQHYMGYGEYLERNSLDDNKIFLLERIATGENTIAAFLNRLEDLAVTIKEKENDYHCKFVLSTIHSCKGLEYEEVYLMDVRDGLFPEQVLTPKDKVSEEERKTYEEERRLFYVAMTRAKDKLFVMRYRDGGSSFVKEILPQGVSVIPPSEKKKSSLQSAGYKSYLTLRSANKNTDVPAINLGDRVWQKTYGTGLICDLEGDPGDEGTLFTVEFEHYGKKKFHYPEAFHLGMKKK